MEWLSLLLQLFLRLVSTAVNMFMPFIGLIIVSGLIGGIITIIKLLVHSKEERRE